VLLSGNEKLIREWEEKEALERTQKLRPNLLNDEDNSQMES
ncbi:MAG: tRNA (guanosine(37)-N1)-methyltransferase TrmD, partial [Bacteroidales bacterium]